jgi:SAM-dependent methyltransferase
MTSLRAQVRSAIEKLPLPVAYYLRARWCSLSGLANGLPVPPPRLTWLVAGHYDVVKSLRNGIITSQNIRHALSRNGLDIEQFPEILDFGCGSGRVLRNWRLLAKTKVNGVDCNAEHIRWCRKFLPFALFERNDLHPPLGFPAEAFAFVYACSVFTHLGEPLQRAWMAELRRVLKEGGCLLITTHGEALLEHLGSADQSRFRAGDLVVVREDQSGTNACTAFHPAGYVRQRLAIGFDVVDFIPAGASGTGRQDIHLLRKN